VPSCCLRSRSFDNRWHSLRSEHQRDFAFCQTATATTTVGVRLMVHRRRPCRAQYFLALPAMAHHCRECCRRSSGGAASTSTRWTSPVRQTWPGSKPWLGQEQRAKRLREAIVVAQADPPKVYRGDLLSALPDIARLAPKDAQLVVFHTAVLGYVASKSDRDAFASAVRQTGAVWISNEAPDVFPEFAQSAAPPPSPGHFLLAIDGKPVAWTAPHGQSIEWFAS